MGTVAVVDRLVATLERRDATGVAESITRLTADRVLAGGTKLPTIRVIAAALGVSPTTVADAWRVLLRQGVIETRGRNGSFVLEPRPATAPRRFWRLAAAAGHLELDLSAGVPDPGLLPDPRPALARAAGVPRLTSYLDDPVLPALRSSSR